METIKRVIETNENIKETLKSLTELRRNLFENK